MIAIIVSLLAGLFVSGIVFRHQRMFTYMGACLALAWGWWLVLTFIGRTWLSEFPPTLLYGFGPALLAVIFLPWWKQWRLPYRNAPGSGWRDLMVMLALLPVMGAAYMVWQVNGREHSNWVWHGFFNGDTATFASLVEKSFLTPGLATDNPFAAGLPLEYPTLVHAGVAALFGADGATGWTYFLPTMTYVAIFVIVAAFWLLFDILFPESLQPRWLGLKPMWAKVMPLLGVLYVMALGWDNFIYPQSHFFLLGLWVVVAALFGQGLKNPARLRGMTLFLASVFTVVLIAGNAVLGAAALAVALGTCGSLFLDKKNEASTRLVALALGVAFVAIFLVLAPGEPQFGGLQFSYEGASDMMRLLPALALLFIGLALYESRPASTLLGVAGLCVLAGVTFFFSTRDIVVANTSRFLYHALLLGWPFMILPVARLGFWLKRYFLYSTKTLSEFIGAIVVVAALVALLLLPAVASVAQAHDNLMRKDRQEITPAMTEAAWWLEDHTSIRDVIVASPLPPWYIPFMTGRTLLRAGYEEGAYWLSTDDGTLSHLRAAFTGDAKAQDTVAGMGDYLLLTKAERALWKPLSFEKVFDIDAIVIYKLR
ncbi:MAG: hypothetical protein HYZ63_00525 [Candidatus Andersenbacteria bacterium]|nr:hypothetical protein [Candidatus Andersenbacteria bacterium]